MNDLGFYLREKQIIGDRNANPPIPPIIPVSHTAWWAGIKAGRYPKPVKLSPKVSVWRSEDIRKLLERKVGDLADSTLSTPIESI